MQLSNISKLNTVNTHRTAGGSVPLYSAHTHTHMQKHTVYDDCVRQVNGDDLLLGSAPRTATAAHVKAPNIPPPPDTMFSMGWGGLDAFGLLTIIMYIFDVYRRQSGNEITSNFNFEVHRATVVFFKLKRAASRKSLKKT